MHPQPYRRRAVAATLAGLFGLGALAHGQTTPAPASGENDETVTLSEFTVSEASNQGYIASESMTGSRVAVKIIDLPYTVNVLTSEYFEDFAMFELADNITQIGSFTGLDIGGGFNLRGFSSSSQLRDGFYRLGRYGSSNVDRMEIIKGSNAAIYGRTSPGGMVNMISKQPKKREYQKLMLNYGDYDTVRGVLELTGPVPLLKSGNTTYILTLSQYEKGFDIEYAKNRNREAYLAVKHVFADKSSLMLSAEYFHQTRHSINSSAPVVIDAKGTASNLDDVAVGYAKNLAEYNAFGPNSELNRGNTGFSGVYEKRFNSVWSARIAGNYYRARRWDYNQNTGFGTITINPSSGAAPTTARGATPTKGLIIEDGGGIQADALAHYWMFDRKVENRTLMTFDFNDYYRWDPTYNYAAATHPDLVAWNTARTITLTPDLRPVGDIAYFPKQFQWGIQTNNRATKRRTTVLGGLLRHQSSFMDGRLLTYAGARFDAVTFRHRNFLANTTGPNGQVIPPGALIRREVEELKPNIGVNYKITSGLRTFVNYSESYFVNQTDDPSVIAEADYKSEVADGYDYGFKGSYLEDRLTFTVSGFYATRSNVRVTERIETSPGSGNYVDVNRRDGNQLVRGFEIDVNYRVSDEITTGGSWGHVYSIYTDFGSANPLAAGRRVNNVAPDNGSAYIKYAPASGRLRGFSANLRVSYVASTPTEGPNSGDTYFAAPVNGQRVLERSTRQWALRVPSVTTWDAGIRYNWRKDNSNFDHTFAFNVNNIFDKDYLKINKQPGERQSFYFTYTLGHGSSGR